MKKVTQALITSSFLFSSYLCPAQNTFPASGNVGIGTLNPSTGLQLGVLGGEINAKQLYIPGVYNFEALKIGQMGNGNVALEMVNHTGTTTSYGVRITANVDNGGNGMQFQYAPIQNSYAALEYRTGMFMNIEGNIGIGTLTPNERLSVNGNIRAKEIKVETGNWPDYVFEDDYKITPLSELEMYIRANKHLPDIPSAKQVSDEGLKLGEINKLLLKKIEELTLYVIELKKDNQIQERDLQEIKKQLKK